MVPKVLTTEHSWNKKGKLERQEKTFHNFGKSYEVFVEIQKKKIGGGGGGGGGGGVGGGGGGRSEYVKEELNFL